MCTPGLKRVPIKLDVHMYNIGLLVHVSTCIRASLAFNCALVLTLSYMYTIRSEIVVFVYKWNVIVKRAHMGYLIVHVYLFNLICTPPKVQSLYSCTNGM